MSDDNILSRRSLLLGAGTFATLYGLPMPFGRYFPQGLLPVSLAQEESGLLTDKKDLTIFSERPFNMETPAHLLDDSVTPGNRMFVRNNGQVPDVSSVTDDNWILEIDGEVETPLRLSITDLKKEFESVSLQLQIECGGNGRRFFSPGASGNQWTFGAVACPQWTGVRLGDVLKRAGLKKTAVYTAHYSADRHLSGDPKKDAISRGVPITKALDPHTMIAWAMNGDDIPVLNGYPLRLVVPGWPGSCSQKWLTKITLRDRIHDGAKMTGQSYRVPAYPVAPGTEVPNEDMVIIESMPVKSLITSVKTGIRKPPDTPFNVLGHAWAGDRAVSAVHVSIDFGRNWQVAQLSPPVNRYAWQDWSTEVTLPQAGYYEIWARATDEKGEMQPATTPGWNPRGYLNNMQHRVAVFAV